MLGPNVGAKCWGQCNSQYCQTIMVMTVRLCRKSSTIPTHKGAETDWQHCNDHILENLMAKNKANLVFVAYVLLIASMPLAVTTIVLAAFAIMALVSSPQSGGGLHSSLSFLLLSVILGGCCTITIKIGISLLRRA
jgi:hypothetical protein